MQSSAADDPTREELCTGHLLDTPLLHQRPAKQGAHRGPAYPGLHTQEHTAPDAMYDDMAGAPEHESHSLLVVDVQLFRSVWPTAHGVHALHAVMSTWLVSSEYVLEGQASLTVRPAGQYAPAGHATEGAKGMGQ